MDRSLDMVDIKNTFLFSFSRYDSYESCNRAYFYSYYFQFYGWNDVDLEKSFDKFKEFIDIDDIPTRKKLAWIYKKSSGYYIYIGNYFHSVMELILKLARKGEILEKTDLLAVIEKKFRLKISSFLIQHNSLDFLRSPKNKLFFREFLNSSSYKYGYVNLYPFDETDFAVKMLHSVLNLVSSLFDSGFYSKLCKLAKEASVFEVEPKHSYYFPFKSKSGDTIEIDLVAKPDLLTVKDGVLSIFDWKTGNMKNVSMLQMETYAYIYLKLLENKEIDFGKVSKFKTNVISFKDMSKNFCEYNPTIFDEGLLTSKLTLLDSLTRTGLKDNIVEDIDEPRFRKTVKKGKFGCSSCPFLRICNGTSKELGLV